MQQKKKKKYIYNVEFKVLTAIFMKTDIIWLRQLTWHGIVSHETFVFSFKTFGEGKT